MIRLGVVRHVEVQPTIAGEVVADDPESPRRERSDLGLPPYLDESAVPGVPVEEIGQPGDVGRVAVVLLSGSREAGKAGVVIHVAGHEEIQLAVGVVVAEGRGRAPTVVPVLLAGNAKPVRAGVDQECVRSVSGPEEVDVSVPVGIPGRHAHTVGAGGRNPGGLDEPEARSPVFEELIGPFALDEIDVQITVGIAIEEGDSRSHDLGHEIGRAAGVTPAGLVDELDTGSGGHVGETRLRAGRRPGGDGGRQDAGDDSPKDQRRSTDRGPMSARLGVPASCIATLSSSRRIRRTISTPASPKAASPQR